MSEQRTELSRSTRCLLVNAETGGPDASAMFAGESLREVARDIRALEAIVARLRKSVANAERIDLLTDEASVVVVRFVDPMSKDAARLHDLMTLEAAQQRGGA